MGSARRGVLIGSEGRKTPVKRERARRSALSERARLKGVAAIAKRQPRGSGSSSFLSLAKLAPLVSGIPCLQFPGVNQPSQAATGCDSYIRHGNQPVGRPAAKGERESPLILFTFPLTNFQRQKLVMPVRGPDAWPSVLGNARGNLAFRSEISTMLFHVVAGYSRLASIFVESDAFR